jgi:hypothetical protein
MSAHDINSFSSLSRSEAATNLHIGLAVSCTQYCEELGQKQGEAQFQSCKQLHINSSPSIFNKVWSGQAIKEMCIFIIRGTVEK